MILTIINNDKAVYIDGISFAGLLLTSMPNNIHALQWSQDKGWIEYNNGQSNESITDLPTWANDAIGAWEIANAPAITPIPAQPTAEENKATASALLANTDWTTIADVVDPDNSPYLENQSEFVAYRNLLRQIAVYSVDGDINFPDKPSCVWANNN